MRTSRYHDWVATPTPSVGDVLVIGETVSRRCQKCGVVEFVTNTRPIGLWRKVWSKGGRVLLNSPRCVE